MADHTYIHVVDIGNWVRRRPGSRPKWHIVESVIEDRIVTRCGRQMHRVVARSGSRLDVSPVMPLTRMIGQPQLCKQGCEREFVA